MMGELQKHDAISLQNAFPFVMTSSMKNEPTEQDSKTLYSSVICSPKNQSFEHTVTAGETSVRSRATEGKNP